jgi:hypothetical protein
VPMGVCCFMMYLIGFSIELDEFPSIYTYLFNLIRCKIATNINITIEPKTKNI